MAQLPQHKIVLNNTEFPLPSQQEGAKIVYYDNPLTQQKGWSRLIHVMTVEATCRGASRWYVLLRAEMGGQAYIEEYRRSGSRKKNLGDFYKIEDDIEWQDIRAYMEFHRIGGNLASANMLQALVSSKAAPKNKKYMIRGKVVTHPDAFERLVLEDWQFSKRQHGEQPIEPKEEDIVDATKRD